MVKKVTAPKTYDPGRGRPLEHLAYLNRREMDYLRSINGNNMERGPRGLPSFPPDDSLGSSSSTSRAGQGGGGKTGGSSGSSGGATGGGSKGAPSSGRAPAAKAPTAPSPKAPTAPTSPMSGQKTSFSSPRAASSYNKDVALKTGLEKNNAISAVKNTPAIKNDGVTGFKAQSLGVKPIGKTTIGGSRPASPIGPANRDMEVNRNLDRIARDFYNSDPDYQKGLAQQRATVAKSRESVGLLGKGVSPRDTISSPARTAPSTGMTQSEKQALLDKYNPVKAAGRLSDAVSSAASKIYNDPVGTASSGLNSLSDYMRDSYNTIAAGSLSSDPDLRSAAAEKAAEIALNYGIGGLGTSFATKAIPENSLGMFVAPRASRDLWDAAEMGKSLQRRGATEADIFNETAKKTRSGVSGYQKISTPEGETWGFEAYAPLNVRQEIIDRVDPSLLGRVKDATFGKLIGKNSQVRDVVDTSALDEFYGGEFSRTPVEQMYTPGQLGFYNPAGTLGGYNIVENKIAINNPMTPGALSRPGELSSEYFSPVMVHEGQHVFSALDKRANPIKIPQGTSRRTEAERIRRSLEIRGLSMPEKEIQRLAVDAYWKKPGEVLSQLAEKRRLNSPESMKSFDERIAAEDEWNRPFEHRARVERMLRELQDKKRGWRSAWDTIVLE